MDVTVRPFYPLVRIPVRLRKKYSLDAGSKVYIQIDKKTFPYTVIKGFSNKPLMLGAPNFEGVKPVTIYSEKKKQLFSSRAIFSKGASLHTCYPNTMSENYVLINKRTQKKYNLPYKGIISLKGIDVKIVGRYFEKQLKKITSSYSLPNGINVPVKIWNRLNMLGVEGGDDVRIYQSSSQENCELIQKQLEDVDYWVGVFCARKRRNFDSPWITRLFEVNMFLGHLAHDLNKRNAGVVIFDWSDLNVKKDKDLEIIGGRVYIPKGKTTLHSTKYEKTHPQKMVRSFPGKFAMLEGTGLKINPLVVFCRRRLEQEDALASGSSQNKPLDYIISMGEQFRPAYWKHATDFVKQIGMRVDEPYGRLYRKVIERFQKQAFVSTCMEIQETSVDKLVTYDLFKDFVNLEHIQIYVPRTIETKDIKKNDVYRFIFHSIYLTKNPRFHLVSKDRFGSQGANIEFIKMNPDGTFNSEETQDDGSKRKYNYSNIEKLVKHLKSKGDTEIIQPYAPATINGSIYDFRVIWAGYETGWPVIYRRYNEDKDALVPNVCAGGEYVLCKASDKFSYEAARKTDWLRKLIWKQIVSKKQFKIVNDETGEISYLKRSDIVNKNSMLIGFDIAFATTRKNSPSDDELTPYIPIKALNKLKSEKFTITLESFRKVGTDGHLAVFYEMNSNPGMKVATFLEGGKMLELLTYNLAEELADLTKH